MKKNKNGFYTSTMNIAKRTIKAKDLKVGDFFTTDLDTIMLGVRHKVLEVTKNKIIYQTLSYNDISEIECFLNLPYNKICFEVFGENTKI